MTLLAERARERARARGVLYDDVRARLRTALAEAAPGCTFWVYGSLTHRGRFNARSDIDLAATELPPGITPYALAADLEERMGRPVDVVELARTRLREKILREGERWIA